jgi:hypothetical protein
MSETAWLKLAVLARGIASTPAFEDWFARSSGFVRRRNFYNSPNWGPSGSPALPQEIRLLGDRRVTVAVNNYGQSHWRLTWTEEHGPAITAAPTFEGQPIELIDDLSAIRTDSEVARICNLYGGSALSFFSPRACYFFADGTECRFCSLDGTARENHEFAARIKPEEVRQAVTAVVESDPSALTQVMIVGGNDRNLDRGFHNQVDLVCAAADALSCAGLIEKISVHLIAMPPRDHSLVDRLSEVPNVHAGFNLEVWDSTRFKDIAPGKATEYGQAQILRALGRLRDAVGAYRAHSILIAGLEPADSTLAGARWLAAEGISPIINVYHSDRHSSLGLTVRPSYQHLVEVASGTQELHDQYPIQPYWKGCGRNAIDYEASCGMFRDVPPSFGLH